MNKIRKAIYLGFFLILGSQSSYALNNSTPETTNLTAQLINVVNPSCNGASDGSFEIEVTGGVAPYETAIVGSNAGFQNTLVYTGLSFNLYNIVVRDANGDTFTINSFLLTQPSALGLSSTTVAETCNGNDGSVTLTGFGGTAPYSYSFGGSRFGSTDTYSGLAAGTYTASIEDANGCTSTATITIGAYVPRTIAINQFTDITCNGGSNAHVAATVIGSGTVLPLAFSLDGVNFTSNNGFQNLSAGNYTMHVRDGNNCISTQTFDITEPAPLTASIINTPISCFGIDDGTYGWDVSGGTAPYTLQQNGTVIANFNGNNFTQTNVPGNTALATGTYDIVDANGCIIPSPAVAVVGPASALVTSVSSVDASCNGASDGSITVTATGSVGTYSYSIDGINFQSPPTFNNLTAGTYNVSTVPTGFPGCLETKSITIAEPAPITATISVDSNVSNCNGATDGSISVTNVTGGDNSYQFSIDGGTSFQTSGMFTGLAAGSYNILIQDSNGCTTTLSETVAEPTGSGSIVTTEPTCIGAADGSIQFTGFIPTNSSASPTVTINGISQGTITTIPYTGLAAGNYQIDVLDAGGCTTTFNITLNDPAPITATFIIDQEPLCNDSADGIVTVTASGGTGPYEYKLSTDNTFTSNATLTGLVDGNNDIDIRDANGCISTVNISLTAPSALSVTTTIVDITCNGDGDGSIAVTATGGTGNLTYALTGNGLSLSGANSTFTGLEAGSYDITVTDDNGCNSFATVTIVEPTAIEASFLATAPSCSGGNDGLITVDLASGGTGALLYRIDPNANFTTNFNFNGLTAGNYTVEVQDQNGCTLFVPVEVPGFTPISATFDAIDPTCPGGNDGFITNIQAEGGRGGYQFSLDGVNFTTSGFANLSPGNYTLTVRDTRVCTADWEVTYNVTISDPVAPTVNVNVTQNVTCTGQEDGIIEIIATNAATPVTYVVDNGNPVSSNIFDDLAAGQHTVDVIYGPNNCVVSTTVNITEPLEITFSTTVTDIVCNGDGNGVIDVTASGGTGNLTYALTGNGLNLSGASNTFTGLSGGTYDVTITDENGCNKMTTVTVAEPTPINVSYQALPPSCIGGTDGSISINLATGGSGNFQIRLVGANTLEPFRISNLAPGDYDIELVDAAGCSVITNGVTVPEQQPLIADVTVDSNASGCGNADGAFTLSNPRKGFQTNLTVEYSIDGVNYQSSPSFTGLAAGIYTIDIRDISQANLNTGNCTGSITATITEPSGITANIFSNPILCAGDGDGSVLVQGTTGGTAPYEYSLDGVNFGTSNSFTGLNGGNYTVVIRDATGCTEILTTTVVEPTAINATLAPSDITCNGAGDGLITVTASGGTGTLQYSIDGTNFQTSNEFTGLAAGNYTITVTDDNFCTQQLQTTISEPTAIMASFTGTTNPTCNGVSDGTATLDVSGGTAPYQVTIDGTNFFPVPPGGVFTNIGGVEIPTVMIRDANGCEITIPGFTVTEPAPLEATITTTDVSCFGDANGSINIVPVSGTNTSFEYSIDGNNFVTNGSFNMLGPGQYTVTMRETGTGCTNTFNATIFEPAVLQTAFTVSNLLCHDSMDGTILVSASGGTAPYEFSIDGNNFQTEDFTGLTAGTYTVTVRDANNCTLSDVVDILAPAELLSEATMVTDASCNGASDGSAMINATGGTAPYEYSTDAGSTYSSSIDLSQLSAGNYTVITRDANLCESMVNFTISEPAAIQVMVSTTNVTCNGDMNGSFTIAASAGAGGFTYSIDGTNFVMSNSFDNLAAGSYTITVMDDNGCTTSINEMITEPDALVLQFEAVDVSCNGDTDGQIAGIASGGTAPYTYSLDGTNFQSTAFSGLQPGSYTLTVRDANNCEATQTVQIAEPDALVAALVSTTDVSCNSDTDGSLTVSATGGSSPYTYSIDGVNFASQSSFANLAAGSYTVTVRDANNCTNSISATVSEPDALAVIATGSSLLCNGNTDGTVTVTGSGGTGPYEYALDGTNFQSGSTFNSLTAGTYTVTIRDANSCTTTATAEVTEPAVITLSIATTNVTCNGDADGSLMVTATGGTGVLEYSLDGTNFQSGSSFGSLAPGMYTITVQDANGCEMTGAATIIEPAAISISTLITNATCNGDASGEIAVTASGGTGALEYSIDGTNFQSGSSFVALAADTYTVTVRDANGCTNTAPAIVSEPVALTVTAAITNENTITATASGGTGPYEYSIDGTSFQSSPTFEGLTNGTYTITVVDDNGCTASISQALIITSIDDPFAGKSISTYPNPAQNYFIISEVNQGDQISLINLNGIVMDQLVVDKSQKDFKYDISEISQGVFLVVIKSQVGRTIARRRVIKMN